MCSIMGRQANASFVLHDRLCAMILQESDAIYRESINDYLLLSSSKRQGHSNACLLSCANADNEMNTTVSNDASIVNESWREKICEWIYNVVDHFDYNREIVSVAMNYFDRYLSIYSKNRLRPKLHPKLLQAVAVSALQLALKINQSRSNHLLVLAELSRGLISAKNINDMEKSMLDCLSWKLSAPTAIAFLRHYILLMPNESIVQDVRKSEIAETAQFLIELSVCDYYFVRKNMKASSVALASLLNAIKIVLSCPQGLYAPLEYKVPREVALVFIESLYEGVAYCDDTKRCENRLNDIYESGGYGKTRTSSPCAVAEVPCRKTILHCEEKREKIILK